MSTRIILVLVAALAAIAVAALALPVSGSAATVKLIATVGPDAQITVAKASGARVRTLPAGSYTLVVRDRSAEHNFVLRGPGISKTTSVEGTGTSTWRVTLKRGKTYSFFCAPHLDHMRGSFRAR